MIRTPTKPMTDGAPAVDPHRLLEHQRRQDHDDQGRGVADGDGVVQRQVGQGGEAENMPHLPMKPRRKCPSRLFVRTALMRSPCHASQSSSGNSAKAERKKTSSPVGIAGADVFSLADISVKTRADRTLREMPRRGFTGGGFSRVASLEERMQPTTDEAPREPLIAPKIRAWCMNGSARVTNLQAQRHEPETQIRSG